MFSRTFCRSLFHLAACSLLVLITACGGHSGSPVPAPVVAPSALTYATNPAAYTVGLAITSNAPSHGGGSVDAYTVTPSLPAGLALNGTSGAISGTPTAISASASYTVTATNTAGSTSVSLTLTVNDAAPDSLVYSSNPATYTRGVAIPPNMPGHGGGAVISYSVSPGLPAGLSLSTSTGVIDGIPTAITASASYTVTATNSGGSATASLTITVNDAAPSSLVYSSNPGIYTKGVAITPNTPGHGGGAVTSYSVSPGLPAGLSLSTSTGVIDGTPTAITASASYTVTAMNTAGSTTVSLTITVNDAAPSNLVYSSNPATYTRGVAIPPNMPGHGGGAVISYSVSPGLPAGLSLSTSTGVIDGTPTAITASASYIVTATNSGGSATASLTIEVTNPPDVAPAFTIQPSNQAVTAPTAATFTAAVSGSPTPTLQWQRSTNGGTTWTDLAGATSSSYGTPATTSADNGTQFRVVATNTAGSLASTAATLTVASLAKTWQAAGPVGPNSGGIYETPQIGFDGQGNALVIWTQDTVGVPQRDLWANRYVAGTGWGTAQVLFPGVGTRVNRARLGVDANGRALVVWAVEDDPYNPMRRIWSVSFDPSSGWGTAAGIDNDSGSSISGSPKLAVGANGSAVAVWTQGDNASSRVNVCMLTGSTTTGWGGSPSVVATGPMGMVAGTVGAPDVILNAQGAGFAFWQYYDGTNYQLTAAPVAAGTAGTGQIVATAGFFYNPHAAINAAGTAVVGWGQYTGSRLGIFASRYLSGSGWGSPAQLNSLGWTVFNQTPDPQVVLDDAGQATALWIEGTGASSPTVWNHQTATGWGVPEIISYSGSAYRLAGNGVGQLLGSRFSGQNLYGSPSYLSSTADWGAGTLLTTSGYIPLALTMDGSGHGLAVWIQPVTGGYALWGSAYR